MVLRALRRSLRAPRADLPRSFCGEGSAGLRMLALLISALLLGCGPGEPPPPPAPQEREMSALPTAEMRMILEGLKSDHPGMQYAALNTLGQFPTVVQTYREHVQRLQKQSKDKRVRQKATELLASLEE